MSPYQHGEVYVTEDGAETDLDLGHYERFIDENLNKYSNLTTGKVYWNVLNKERKGEYLGSTVQIIPHITNEIKEFIYRVGETGKCGCDIITEIGGTVGDIERQPFLEAIRQVSLEQGNRKLPVHTCDAGAVSEESRESINPSLHSTLSRNCRPWGLSPDIIVMRADEPIDKSISEKISLFCNVKEDCVIENQTLPILYEAPLMLEKSKLSWIVCRELGINADPCEMTEWEQMVERIKARKERVNIAVVGKYSSSMMRIFRWQRHFVTAVTKTAAKWISNGSKQKT